MKNKIKIKLNIYEDGLKILYKEKIDIYDIEYNTKAPIFTIDYRDLEKLESYDYEIVSYKGFKNILFKIKLSKHYIIACLLACTIICALSLFCFQVNIIHSNKDIRVLLEDELYDHGIRPFMPKKSFKEIQDIKNHIKKTYPNDIEWLEIEDSGMKYTVRVEERIITKIEESENYCNIIATKDATINNIIASKGQTVVSTNDLVKKGDVLISGEIKFNEETKAYTCASGTVYGNTWYKVAVKVPLNHTEKIYTGEKKNNIGIEIGSTYNRIFKVHFDHFDIENRPLFKFGSFGIYKEKVKEYKEKPAKYTYEEALEEARKLGREKLKTNLEEGMTILDEKVLQSEEYDSIISIEFFYSVKEIISKAVVEEQKEKTE